MRGNQSLLRLRAKDLFDFFGKANIIIFKSYYSDRFFIAMPSGFHNH